MSTENQSTMENVKKSITEPEQEHTMGQKEPGAPFVVVALTYLGVLAVALITIAVIIWVF